MADSILAIPLSTGGLGDGGWVAVAAFSIYGESYSISATAYDIGCIVSGTYDEALIITPFYFLSAYAKTYSVPFRRSDGSTSVANLLNISSTNITVYQKISTSIILFKST